MIDGLCAGSDGIFVEVVDFAMTNMTVAVIAGGIMFFSLFWS